MNMRYEADVVNGGTMSEILTLSITCVRGRYLSEDYRFVMEVPADSTLADFSLFIRGMVNFDDEHADEFYLANSTRGKKTWLTTDGALDEGDGAAWDICLSKIFPLPKPKKLFYLYDFGDSWCFEITKKGKVKLANPDVEYPCILEEEGVRPEQYGCGQYD